MQKLKNILYWAEKEFKKAKLCFGHGTDNAWDEAVWLALYVLQLPYDIDNKILDQELAPNEEQTIINLVNRRIKERIPAAYLTNEIWFAGLSFYVDERVIIPRSPIAELIMDQFQPWLGNKKITKILDLCTGSSCIAVACAKAFPKANIDAVDISDDALEVAAINIKKHQVASQVQLIKSDLFTELTNKQYNLIISNPPYVSDQEIAMLPQEYQHEPPISLAGGADGLALVDKILEQVPHHLSKNGLLVMDIGNNMGKILTKHPNLPFIWPEFANGGDGVFILNY